MELDSAETVCLAQVLFTYEPQATEELELLEGQVIRVLERNDAGWWLGADIDGRTGWAPSNFLRELSDDEVAMLAQAQGQQSSSFNSTRRESGQIMMTLEEVQVDPSKQGHRIDIIEEGVKEEEELEESAMDGMEIAEVLPQPHIFDQQAPPDPNEASSELGQCSECRKPIDGNFVMAGDCNYHVDCFKCPECQKSLAGSMYVERDGRVYCEDDFHKLFSPRCFKCKEVIRGRYLTALDQTWHEEHFTCTVCSKLFDSDRFRKGEDNLPYCEEHFAEHFCVNCATCSLPITGSVFEAIGKSFHVDCFRCSHDNAPIHENDEFHQHNDKVYCTKHFQELFLDRCERCNDVVIDHFVKVLSKTYHDKCFRCIQCSNPLMSGKFNVFGNDLYCSSCHSQKLATHNPKAPLPTTANKKPTQRPIARVRTIQAANPPPSVPDTMNLLDAEFEKIQEADAPDLKSIGTSNGRTLYRPEQLRNAANLPKGVDASEREMHISDHDFVRIFQMERETFFGLKLWKQQQMKRALGLF